MEPVSDPVIVAFLELQHALTEQKPNDRSAIDRAFAVTMTEVEKAFAYYQVYVERAKEQP